MTVRSLLLLAALVPAACAQTDLRGGPLPDVAQFPPNAFGGGYQDPDVGAINEAGWAFASPARTRNNPGEAARAAASVDYLAGQLYYSPRWVSFSPIVKQEMQDARGEVRSTLGIPAGVPSQAVVDSLLAVTRAAYANDQPAMLAALNTPIFTMGPEATLNRLANLPYLPTTNIATIRANAIQNGPTERSGCFLGCV